MDRGAAARHSAGAASDAVGRKVQRLKEGVQADGAGRATRRTQSRGAPGPAAIVDFARPASFAAEEDPPNAGGAASDRSAAASATGRPSGTGRGVALGLLDAAWRGGAGRCLPRRGGAVAGR